MRLRAVLLPVAALFVVFVASRLEAAPIIFTDRAAFQSVHPFLGLPPLALETFDSNGWTIDIPGTNDPCTRRLNGLKIHSDCHAVGAFQSGNAIFDQSTFTTIAVFDQPQTSLGFDYTLGIVTPDPFNPTANDRVLFGFSNGLTFLLSGSGFLGILDPSEPILSMGTSHVPESLANGVLGVDNLLLTRVPEPSTSLLFGSGIVLLQAARHLVKRRRS
jgi:hypothetical protein